MPYEPTGRPPGRPRKDGLPKANEVSPPPVKPSVIQPPPARPPAAKIAGQLTNAPQGIVAGGPFPICTKCYPDGWPKGATGLGCPHGIWSRPAVPQ